MCVLAVTYHRHFWQNDGDLFCFFRFETNSGRNQIQQYKFLGREMVKNDREECDGDGGAAAAAPPPPPHPRLFMMMMLIIIIPSRRQKQKFRFSDYRAWIYDLLHLLWYIQKNFVDYLFLCGLFVGVLKIVLLCICMMVKMGTKSGHFAWDKVQNCGKTVGQ